MILHVPQIAARRQFTSVNSRPGLLHDPAGDRAERFTFPEPNRNPSRLHPDSLNFELYSGFRKPCPPLVFFPL